VPERRNREPGVVVKEWAIAGMNAAKTDWI
jgi:hypothetical protein